MSFDMQKYVYSESAFNALYIEIKTQMLKKSPFDKIRVTKNFVIFISPAPTFDSFTFNLRFLYELKYKVRLSETLWRIFHFQFRFVFIKVYIFVQKNAWTF